MGLALIAGAFLARKKYFVAHGLCQSAVVVLNLIPVFLFMAKVFRQAVVPGLPAALNERYYAIATAHAALGSIAEVLGIYIILSAGLKVLPNALTFENYKPWMRAELAIWWLVILFGIGTYWIWYVSPTAERESVAVAQEDKSAPAVAASPEASQTVNIDIGNFAFDPKEIEIEAGTTVVWKNKVGRHTVTTDDNSFDSPIMAPGEEFKQKFEHAGIIKYYCKLHGSAGGHNMSGVIKVK